MSLELEQRCVQLRAHIPEAHMGCSWCRMVGTCSSSPSVTGSPAAECRQMESWATTVHRLTAWHQGRGPGGSRSVSGGPRRRRRHAPSPSSRAAWRVWRMDRCAGGGVMDTGVLDWEPAEEAASLVENGLLGSSSRLRAEGGSCRSLLAGDPGPFCCSGTVGRWCASVELARGGMVAGQASKGAVHPSKAFTSMGAAAALPQHEHVAFTM